MLTKKAEQAQKEAADAKRLLHELSTGSFALRQQAKERFFGIAPIEDLCMKCPNFITRRSRINPDCRYDYSTTWQTKYTLECICTSNCWSKLRTTDPKKLIILRTTLHIVFHACQSNKLFSANDMVQKSLHWVQQTHPYWNRTLGRDQYGLLLMTLGPAWRLFVRCGTLFSSQIRGSCTIAAEPWLITLGCILRTTSRKNVICLCHATHRGKILLLHL